MKKLGFFSTDGRHPVSALMELCSSKKWLPPEFVEIGEDGPPHQRRFLIKCNVNNVDYVPSEMSYSKKLAKAAAALTCLQALGIVQQT